MHSFELYVEAKTGPLRFLYKLKYPEEVKLVSKTSEGGTYL